MRRFTFLAAACVAAALVMWAVVALGPASAGFGGQYPQAVNVQDDPAGHAPFIQMPPNIILQVEQDADFISIDGPHPWVQVTGTIDLITGQIAADGSGTVVGIPDIDVEFDGIIKGNQLIGKYAMGTDGDLPHQGQPNTGNGQPIVYELKPKDDGSPTVTQTPDHKKFSIMVLKEDENGVPLEGWEFNIFAGGNCIGTPFDSGFTDEDGLLDFTGLESGSYSVLEKLQPGWNNVTPLCQNIATMDSPGTAGLPPCPIPNLPFPSRGCDEFGSAARVKFRLNGSDEEHLVGLNGPTLIARHTQPEKVDGFDTVETEIIAMELTGTTGLGLMTVRESPTRVSAGLIVEQENTGANKMNFPANSFFDVFFEVDVAGMTLHNEDPLRMECKIEDVPPIMCFYLPPVLQPIVLYNSQGVKVATLIHAMHIPLPPNEVLLVFTNDRKDPPTPKPSQTPVNTATPTSTTQPVATATPTRTVTPQPPTPTREKPCGDVNDDGVVDSRDALLVLQFAAGLLDELPNRESADVDGDGDIDAIDAALMLQFGAGLLSVLNC